ncbi:hypothetical protein ACVXZY_06975 [Staphylococcus aureus]
MIHLYKATLHGRTIYGFFSSFKQDVERVKKTMEKIEIKMSRQR